MVTGIMSFDDARFDRRDNIVEYRNAILVALEPNAVESPRSFFLGKAPRQGFLFCRKDVEHDALPLCQLIVQVGSLVDAGEDERRIQAQRAERAHCHSEIRGSAASRQDCNAGRESPEDGTEGVGIQLKSECRMQNAELKSAINAVRSDSSTAPGKLQASHRAATRLQST